MSEPRVDRRVHARLEGGAEVVRYRQARKWYLEGTSGRVCLTLGDAVSWACAAHTEVFFGLPHGGAFDRRVRAALEQEGSNS